jgi:hypothetical protein
MGTRTQAVLVILKSGNLKSLSLLYVRSNEGKGLKAYVMSSEDPTKRFNSTEHATQPTIITVLERISALGESLGQQMKAMESRLVTNIGEVSATVRRVERKIEILNDSVLEVRADHRDMERVERLESLASYITQFKPTRLSYQSQN